MTTTTNPVTLLRRFAAALACALALVCAATATAQAEFGLQPGSFRAEVTDSSGAIEERAGATPYAATTSFDFRVDGDGKPDGNVKNIDVELPAGFVGNPQALPQCTGAEFSRVDPDTFEPGCPIETQLGVATNTVDIGFPLPIDSGVYNLVPPPGAPAAFGFTVLGVPVTVVASVRDDDQGLTMRIRGISGSTALYGSALTFWGVPGDSETRQPARQMPQHGRQMHRETVAETVPVEPRQLRERPAADDAARALVAEPGRRGRRHRRHRPRAERLRSALVPPVDRRDAGDDESRQPERLRRHDRRAAGRRRQRRRDAGQPLRRRRHLAAEGRGRDAAGRHGGLAVGRRRPRRLHAGAVRRDLPAVVADRHRHDRQPADGRAADRRDLPHAADRRPAAGDLPRRAGLRRDAEAARHDHARPGQRPADRPLPRQPAAAVQQI